MADLKNTPPPEEVDYSLLPLPEGQPKDPGVSLEVDYGVMPLPGGGGDWQKNIVPLGKPDPDKIKPKPIISSSESPISNEMRDAEIRALADDSLNVLPPEGLSPEELRTFFDQRRKSAQDIADNRVDMPDMSEVLQTLQMQKAEIESQIEPALDIDPNIFMTTERMRGKNLTEELAKNKELRKRKSYIDSAIQFAKQAQDYQDVDKQEGVIKNFKIGLKSLLAVDFATFGTSEIKRLYDIKSIYEKASEEGFDSLTDEEQSLVSVYQIMNIIASGKELPSSFNIGRIMANMVPFLIELSLTGGTRKITSEAVQKLIKAGIKKNVQKHVVRDAAGTVAGLITGAAVQSNFMSPQYIDYQRRRVNQYGVSDQFGELQITINKEHPITSALKAWATGTTEIASEQTGKYMALGVKKLAGNLMKKSATKEGKSFLITLAKNIRKETLWHGSIYEYAEENRNNVTQAILTGDRDLKDLWGKKEQWEIFASTLLMGGVYRSVSIPGEAHGQIVKLKFKNSQDRMDANIPEEIRMQIDEAWKNEDTEKVRDELNQIDISGLSNEQQFIIADYLKKRIKNDITNGIEEVQEKAPPVKEVKTEEVIEPGKKKVEGKEVTETIKKDTETAKIHKKLLADTGGSTLTLEGENLVGKDLSSVDVFPNRTETSKTEFTEKQIQEFITKNRDLLEENKELAVGTFYSSDSKEYSIGVSAVVGHEKAEELGKTFDQESVFNLKTGKLVPTGGTGKVKTKLTDAEIIKLTKTQVKPEIIEHENIKKKKDIVKEAGIDLMEDKEGNYVFWHYGPLKGDKTDPTKPKQPYTTDKRIRNVTTFYTSPVDKEGVVTSDQLNSISVPKEKVYPFNEDPLNFYDKVKAEWAEKGIKNPTAPQQMDLMHKYAVEAGYEMIVAEWGTSYRAESSVPLKYKADATIAAIVENKATELSDLTSESKKIAATDKKLRNEWFRSLLSKGINKTMQDPELFKKAPKEIQDKWNAINKKYEAVKPEEKKVEEKKEPVEEKKLDQKEIAKAKVAKGFEDLMQGLGGLTKVEGEQAPDILKALREIAEGIFELGVENIKDMVSKMKASIPVKNRDQVSKIIDDNYEMIEKIYTERSKVRARAKKILEDPDISPEIKKGLSVDAINYIPKANAITAKEADAIIEAKGLAEAINLLTDEANGIAPSVRVALALRLINQLNEDSYNEALSKEDRQKAENNAIRVAEFMTVYGTKLGQGLQAFNIMSKLSPRILVNKMIKDIEKNTGRPITEAEKKKIKELADKVKAAPEGFQKKRAVMNLLKYQLQVEGIKFGDLIMSVWYANILSGFKTHELNTLANLANVGGEITKSMIYDPRFFPNLVIGLMNGFSRGVLEGWNTIKTGESPAKNMKIDMNIGSGPSVLEAYEGFKIGEKKINLLKIHAFPGRVLSGVDAIFFYGLKEMRIRELYYLEAKKKKLKGKAITEYIDVQLLNSPQAKKDAQAKAEAEGLTKLDLKRRVWEILDQAIPEEINEITNHFASRGTFNHPPEGKIGRGTDALIGLIESIQFGKYLKPAKFVIPFTRVLTNVANTYLDYSPYGFVRAARGDIGGLGTKGTKYQRKYTPEERAKEYIAATVGTIAAMSLLYLTGVKDDDDEPVMDITANGTGDYKDNYILKQTGWMEYSVKIGEKWISYKNTPIAIPLQIIGNVRDFQKYHGTNWSNEELLKKTEIVMMGTVGYFTDMTFLKGASEFMSIFSESDPYRAGEDVGRFMGNLAKGFVVPNLVTQVSRQVQSIYDMPMKQATGIWQQMYRDIPIARNSLNDMVNVLGDPVIPDMSRWVSEVEYDPAIDIQDKNNAFVTTPDKNMLTYNEDGDLVKIDEDQFYEYAKLRGQLIRSYIEKDLTKLQEMDRLEVQKKIKDYTSTATKKAKRELMIGKKPWKSRYTK